MSVECTQFERRAGDARVLDGLPSGALADGGCAAASDGTLRSRASRWLRVFARATFVIALVAAASCSTDNLVVGDDSQVIEVSGAAPASAALADAATFDAPTPSDASDASSDDGPLQPAPCASVVGAKCMRNGSACHERDETGLTCDSAGTFCCRQDCPRRAPPTNICDGGPFGPVYDKQGCVGGYACGPLACDVAGGTCVGLTPSACGSGNWGSATVYTCSGGIGVGCCLP